MYESVLTFIAVSSQKMVNKVGSEIGEIEALDAVNRLPEVAELVEHHSDEDEVEVVQKKVTQVHSNLLPQCLTCSTAVLVDCNNLK